MPWLRLALLLFLTASPRFHARANWVAKLKPEIHPELKDLPNNTWKRLPPNGDTFDRPKTEVGLVYDERFGEVVCFGACYCRQVE
jgi:hypothetical protein